jgi:hypothetical protein
MSSEQIDKIVLFLTAGYRVDAIIAQCVKSFGVDEEQARKLVDEARRKITVAADYAREEQLGTAITRLNDLYSKSVASQDTRTALQAQRELNRLMGLYAAAPMDSGGGDDDAARRLDLIAGYILPLKLTDERYPVEEHARVAAEIIRQNRLIPKG